MDMNWKKKTCEKCIYACHCKPHWDTNGEFVCRYEPNFKMVHQMRDSMHPMDMIFLSACSKYQEE
jgi:hypothetical protein